MKNILSYLFSVMVMMGLWSNEAFAVLMPNTDTKNEITAQLLELAVANIDKRFAYQFDKVVASEHDAQVQAIELQKAFFLIRDFRQYYQQLDWSIQQGLNLTIPVTPIAEADIEEYDNRISNNTLLSTVLALRPQTPRYLEYRRMINELLAVGDPSLPKYKFRVLSTKNSGDDVNTLKQVLQALGYLEQWSPLDGIYDVNLMRAVKDFQQQNNLASDGVVGLQTYRALYRTPAHKAMLLARAILRLNDERLQSLPLYVFVNVPEAMLQVYDQGKSALVSRVIVGKPKMPTPLLDSKINNIVFNPKWTVPESIAKDYLARLRYDREYLQRKGLYIVDYHGNEVSPYDISDKELSFNRFRYLIVQNPGTSNALGLYKFNFPNSESVYLHSTSTPAYFKRENRALSSGCVRVAKSRELAEYLLQDTSYNAKRIDKILQQGKTHWATLRTKVPVLIAYWTAYLDEAGQVHYFDDVYDLDNKALPTEVMQHFRK